jgi:hypothetical protein
LAAQDRRYLLAHRGPGYWSDEAPPRSDPVGVGSSGVIGGMGCRLTWLRVVDDTTEPVVDV